MEVLTRESTQALLDRMPAKARAELRAVLRNAAHLFTCTPFERVPIPGPKQEDRHVWRREFAPEIDGEGCVCVAWRWNGCVV